MLNETIPIPLSLYIHIPWCVKKCPYCDFNSHEARQDIPEETYINALVADLESELPHIWGRSIESIFIGGGTPSLFSGEAIDTLLQRLRERLPIRPRIEITLEANPGTFEQARFSAYRQAGINRLSVGIQSYNDTHLKALGRIHGANEASQASDIAQRAGFDNINLDLMFGLPKQTVEQALADLSRAIAAKPKHISWYQLTIEENTLFHHVPPPVPHDEHLWQMQQQGQALLKQAGFEQYEVSAYAQPQRQSQHNLNYWQFGDYLGIGAGAHGKLTQPDGSIIRHTKHRNPRDYMKKALEYQARSSEKALDKADIIFEFMLNVARLKHGFSKTLFESRTRLAYTEIAARIDALQTDGLLKVNEEQIKPTEKGQLFANDIVNRFLQ